MVSLQEATELSQLFQSIEGAFAAGELQKIADMLATMRRSLKLVGNVPEFSGGMERLQARGTSAILDPRDNSDTVAKVYSSQCQSHPCPLLPQQPGRCRTNAMTLHIEYSASSMCHLVWQDTALHCATSLHSNSAGVQLHCTVRSHERGASTESGGKVPGAA